MSQSSSVDNSIITKLLQSVAGAPPEVYSPSDDTFLMLDALSKLQLKDKDVLDIGTGSGMLALYCAVRGANVTATDIDEKALQQATTAAQNLQVKLRVVLSDLFSNVRGQFDVITFNPPYLPSKETTDPTTDGGKQGQAVAERFLGELEDHMKREGTALMILTTISDVTSLSRRYDALEFSTIASKRLFFEELRVLQLRFRQHAAR